MWRIEARRRGVLLRSFERRTSRGEGGREVLQIDKDIVMTASCTTSKQYEKGETVAQVLLLQPEAFRIMIVPPWQSGATIGGHAAFWYRTVESSRAGS